MDPLITIIIFGAAAILSAILKRKRTEGEQNDSWPNSARPSDRGGTQPPPERVSWEEELRRLLEGESGKPPPQPPPIIRETPRPTAPSSPPVVVREPPKRPSLSHPRKVRPQPAGSAASRPLHDWQSPPPRQKVELEGLHESLSAYEQARQLDEQAKARLQRAAERLVSHSRAIGTPAGSAEIQDALDLFRSPQTLRSAIVASVVLGTPKGLE